MSVENIRDVAERIGKKFDYSAPVEEFVLGLWRWDSQYEFSDDSRARNAGAAAKKALMDIGKEINAEYGAGVAEDIYMDVMTARSSGGRVPKGYFYTAW
jgi:hypothetical protein